jgi:hypothetical protein
MNASRGTYKFLQLHTVSAFSTRDERVAIKPVLKQVVEQQTRGILVAMCRFFLCVAESCSDGQEHKWVCFSAIFDLGQRAEDIDEIATSLHHDQVLRMRQPAFAVRVYILIDADDSLVCADE